MVGGIRASLLHREAKRERTHLTVSAQDHRRQRQSPAVPAEMLIVTPGPTGRENALYRREQNRVGGARTPG